MTRTEPAAIGGPGDDEGLEGTGKRGAGPDGAEVERGARLAVTSAATAAATWPTSEDLRPACSYRPPRRPVRRPPSGTVPTRDPGPSLAQAVAAITAHNKALRAFVHLDAELVDPALLDPNLVEADLPGGGPLLSVKDVIHVAGMPTRAGSAGYLAWPDADATAVARLRRAGYRVLGKTETHELALGVTTPQSAHPRDPSRIAGGSSGGAAISLATGMAALALGTDTRASIRVPAALCGVVGFKPTFGTVPTDGVVTLSWSMDHVAPMACTVADAALALDVLAGTSCAESWRAPIAGRRIGVASAGFEGCDDEVVKACLDALGHLESLGAQLVDAPDLGPAWLELANEAGLVVSRCEAAAFHRGRGTPLDRLTPETSGQLAAAAEVPTVAYLAAQRARTTLAERLIAEAERLELDGWALPTAPVVAPLRAEAERYLTALSRNAIPWSFTGFPALSVPAPTGGLPVGLQLTAPPGEDATLVTLASAVEQG